MLDQTDNINVYYIDILWDSPIFANVCNHDNTATYRNKV